MRVILAILTLAIAGCTAANDAADSIARKQAKSVVNEVMQARFPGINIAPVTDCVIDAASAGEILSLARASVTEITPETAETVLEISTRPDAVQCYAENGLTLLGG